MPASGLVSGVHPGGVSVLLVDIGKLAEQAIAVWFALFLCGYEFQVRGQLPRPLPKKSVQGRYETGTGEVRSSHVVRTVVRTGLVPVPELSSAPFWVFDLSPAKKIVFLEWNTISN